MTDPTPEQLLAALNAHQRTDHEQCGIAHWWVESRSLDDWAEENVEKMSAALLAAAGVTPEEPGEHDNEFRQRISDLRLRLADATKGWRAALEVMENHKCHDQAERAYARTVKLREALAAAVQVDEAKLAEVTRVTLVGRAGERSAEHWDYAGVKLSMQDDERTLKILPLRSGVR